MDKLLTVVIPAYNIEKYEEQCLSSFVKPKALPEIEVLVVNDGSSDRTVEIAEKYVQKYPDIFRVINKENGGHGSTINRGIEEARGNLFQGCGRGRLGGRSRLWEARAFSSYGQIGFYREPLLLGSQSDRRKKAGI